jgi:hypothetical protein
MSKIIINNNPHFICHYPKENLPQCDYTGRDMRFLISQAVGTALRGDIDEHNKVLDEINAQFRTMDEHTVNGWYRQLDVALRNNQELGAKYITEWLEQKINRS